MVLPAAVAREFAAHAGCAAVSRLIAVEGVTYQTLHRWRRCKVTERLHRGVDRLVGAPQTAEQRLWGAVLRAGEHAMAGPRSTLWLHQLEGFEALDLDVVVAAPHRSRGTGFPAMTRRVGSADRATVRGFPALSVPRAIIECAHTCDPKRLRVLLDDASRAGVLRLDRLQRRALALRNVPGCRRGAAAVLALLAGGAMDKESENERALDAFLASTTLELEWQVTDIVPGRRLDAVDRAAAMILEIDSRLWHNLGSDRDADGLRDLEIAEVAPDHIVFHLTLGMVRDSPAETRRRLDAIRSARAR